MESKENISGMAMPTTEETFATGSADGWVCPEFKVSGIFSDHMVLQQEKPIKVWGFSSSVGSVVKGEFYGDGATAEVGTDNRWELVFSARLYTCEPQTMKIYDDKGHTVIFGDVLIGDVWVVGGQSNAELNLAPCMALTPSVDFCEDDNFRLFRQTQAYPYEHPTMCEHPQRDIINPDWKWELPGEEASLRFSAVGWYFARELTKHIGVPVGMVMACAGGACIRELVPSEIADVFGYDCGANVCRSGYYNTLIAPLIPLAFKAMIFFQGESEGIVRAYAERYTYELAVLVADERRSFGFDFPFYNIQLSSYTKIGAQLFPFNDIIRMQQFDAVKVIPNSNLTVDMDLGADEDYPDWPHSPRKLELAERLSALALAREYGIGKESEVSSPMPVGAVLSGDKKTIQIEFINVGSGLTVSGQSPVDSLGKEIAGFSVGKRDVKLNARAVVTSRCSVTVDIPDGADLSCVSYAYENLIYPETANLRNGANLPAPAFSLMLK